MKSIYLKAGLIITANVMMVTPIWAGFDVTRMTTVVDDVSGSYTVTKSGRLDDQQFTGTSLTEFNQFHPGSGDKEANISGVISKQTSRGGGHLNTVSDGNFMLHTVENIWSVEFEGLQVAADEDGVELTGDVLINTESYDVNALPDGVAQLLRRVFWLTRR